MAVVTFDSTAFLQRYPEFAMVSPTNLGLCFTEATLYLNNTDNSAVSDIPTRTLLLWMLTAHIAYLNYGANGNPPTQRVGRVSSAGQGTVSVSTQMGTALNGRAWYDQTKYGAAYWQASLRFRGATYVTPPQQPVVVVPRN